MYYLQSRYYDPEVGRFLNADDTCMLGMTDSVLGNNLFAYCENEPVNSWDLSGFYSAKKAAEYAKRYWKTPNKNYKINSNDCANFVSQCLYAGDLSKMTGVGKYGWHHYRLLYSPRYNSLGQVINYGPSVWQISNAWGVASDLYKWLSKNNHVKKCIVIHNKKELDSYLKTVTKKPHAYAAIFFDWENDGTINHAALSGQIETTKVKANVYNYDMYFYAHTSPRGGKKIAYDGKPKYVSLRRELNGKTVIYICELK